MLVDEIDALRHAVGQARRHLPFQVDGWVVLPDHMHCVWTVPAIRDGFGARWRAISDGFCEAVGAESLWRDRPWHHRVGNPADYAACLRFCWEDPVRHNLVARSADWPFCGYLDPGVPPEMSVR